MMEYTFFAIVAGGGRVGVPLMADEGDGAADLRVGWLLREAKFVEERPPLVGGEAAGVVGLCRNEVCAGHDGS
jgi:hypothetical protein